MLRVLRLIRRYCSWARRCGSRQVSVHPVSVVISSGVRNGNALHHCRFWREKTKPEGKENTRREEQNELRIIFEDYEEKTGYQRDDKTIEISVCAQTFRGLDTVRCTPLTPPPLLLLLSLSLSLAHSKWRVVCSAPG